MIHGKKLQAADGYICRVMRRKDFYVSDEGYFLYCNGDRFTDKRFLGDTVATMYFKIVLLPYRTTLDWIEPALLEIKRTLDNNECPPHSSMCEYGRFIEQISI